MLILHVLSSKYAHTQLQWFLCSALLCLQIQFQKFLTQAAKVVKGMQANAFHTIVVETLKLTVSTTGPAMLEIQVWKRMEQQCVVFRCLCVAYCVTKVQHSSTTTRLVCMHVTGVSACTQECFQVDFGPLSQMATRGVQSASKSVSTVGPGRQPPNRNGRGFASNLHLTV